jgi:chromosomal replication initiator protein
VRSHGVHRYASINQSYTFDNFVVGPSNSLAHAAAFAVTESPGILYNPLFMYGDSGLGKTHLLHAIGNKIKQSNPQVRVLYQTADRFVTEFINAIRFNKIHKFQAKYQKIDVLLIDDIQFISNKEQTQEAFFHIFNTLYDARKQIVFSSDVYPKDIKGLAERLRSRLACGLVTDVRAPRLETKIAILKRKAQLNTVVVNDEVLHFIASLVNSNIRELEGALIRVVAFASLTQNPISLELAQKVLMRVREQEMVKVNFMSIVKTVQKYYTYDFTALRSKARNKNLSFVRQLTMFLMKKMTNRSLREIGSYIGGRDHSTVVHAVSKIEQYIQNNPAFSEKLHKIENDILR